MSRSLVDGVERCPLLDVKVVVIGGGVGGLLAALECWRKGCDVVVLEKSKDISPLGTKCNTHQAVNNGELT